MKPTQQQSITRIHNSILEDANSTLKYSCDFGPFILYWVLLRSFTAEPTLHRFEVRYARRNMFVAVFVHSAAEVVPAGVAGFTHLMYVVTNFFPLPRNTTAPVLPLLGYFSYEHVS